MCCTRLAGNTGRTRSPFWHHRRTLSGYIFGTKACIDNRLISAFAIGCLPYFHTWCGLSANLRCRSETCTQVAENTERKKVAKNRHLGTIAQVCRAISSQLRHVSTIGKNRVKLQYVHNMVNLGPLAAEIGLPVWGTPARCNYATYNKLVM